ncbi:MAG: hypothetical protein GKR88_01415 [Flavobacteriaceae bacterium]|nr:MAG: hypothetical protein GKR88_01415 [Flavobacteriaceae bacterium]
MENYKSNFYTSLFVVVLAIILNSCASKYDIISKSEIKGEYEQKGDKGIKLFLKENSFVLIDTYKQEHLPPYNCCDTLAYGKWEIDKKLPLLILSTPEELGDASNIYDSYYLNMDVIEELKPQSDSITIIINNPIENFYKQQSKRVGEIEYTVSISSNDINFDSSMLGKRYNSNLIVLSRKENVNIDKLEIEILVKSDISIKKLEARYVYTLPYDVKNGKSNVFKIDIPELSYGFLSYKRLDDDYVKILNKNKLLWDGKEYIRK